MSAWAVVLVLAGVVLGSAIERHPSTTSRGKFVVDAGGEVYVCRLSTRRGR